MFAALLVAGIQGIGSGYVFLEPPRNFDAMFAWTSLFPQFDLSRPSPSNEACYVLLSLLASTPCLVLFLVFPFVGVVPIETRHSTGLCGFIFLFLSMLAWTFISHQFDWSRPSPNNEACYVLLSLLDSTPCLVLFLVFPFVGVVPIETRHSTGLSGFIFLFFEYACLISCHCFCCSHSVSLLSLFLALFIVFLEKNTGSNLAMLEKAVTQQTHRPYKRAENTQTEHATRPRQGDSSP